MKPLNQSLLDRSLGPRRPNTFEPGSTFGEYTILRRIGRGGQGSVFEVRDGLGLHWALKVSEEMALQDANAEMRFAREARCVAESLSQLPRHSGVFVGEHYGVWDRRFYVKMKLLRGESLAQRLRRVGQLPICDAVRLAERIAFAIGQAHELGVLHRDLKPENVFLTEQGDVVVLDWGCLQLIEAGQQKTTLRGVVCTPGYAPIEQYLATTALNLTPAVDLYALGVILYEALAGYHPFLNWSRAALKAPAASSQGASANKQAALAGECDGLDTATAPSGAGAPFLPASQQPDADHSLYVDGSEHGSMATVPVEDVFGAQTERHVVPPELLSHLRGIVTGGVTWRSAPEGRVTTRLGPFGTAATQPLPRQTEPSRLPAASSARRPTGWTILEREPAASTRTQPRAYPGAGSEAGTAAADANASPNESAPIAPRLIKGDVPRRFSVIEVLTFQEKVKPRPVEGIPPALSSLLLQLLAKRPNDRPQNALEVSERLRALLPRLLEAPVEFAASTLEHNSRYLTRALLWIRLRQNSTRWAWAAAGVVVAGLTGALAYVGMAASRAAPGAPSTIIQAAQSLASVGGAQLSTGDLYRVVVAAAPVVVSSNTVAPIAEVPSAEMPSNQLPSIVGASTAVAGVVAASALPANAMALGAAQPSAETRVAPSRQRTKPPKKKPLASVSLEAADVTIAAVTAPAAANPNEPPCGPSCDDREQTGDARNPRLQAKPNAVIRRSSNQLWVE